MIDLHCHILPGLDDGPDDAAVSIEMARIAAADGLTRIVATPHVREDYLYDLAEIERRTEALNHELAAAGIRLRIVPGAELALTMAPQLSDDQLGELCLGSGSYLLVESPYSYATDMLERDLFDLQVRGFQVILAHPERSPSFIEDPDRLAAIVERGVLCSITAASLTGRFGRPVKRGAMEMLLRGLVHNVASDAHSAGDRRPVLTPAVDALKQELPRAERASEWLAEDVPEAILSGLELPPAPPTIRGDSGRGVIRAMLGRIWT